MTKNAVVFSGRNGLDFSELRDGVLRIPEVMTRLREAQRILDTLELEKIDLINIVAADDEFFFRNIKLKSLVSAIVQVGLFERFLKTQRKPDYMVGNSNGDSAMLVCVGQQTFEDMVRNSSALDTLRPSERVVVSLHAPQATLLSGISLTEYQAWKSTPNPDAPGVIYHSVRSGLMELKKIVLALHLEQGVTRYVNIGPASALRGSDYKNMGSDEIESLDSIDLDPMLGWFWRNMRPQATALAQ